MVKLLARGALMLLVSLMTASAVSAQVQTGELTGIIKTSDGLSLPGATVTITSPALQGSRTIVSDENGAYVIHALPPGNYSVTVEMSGMSPRTENIVVELGRTAKLDVTLQLASVSETVTVSANTESAALTSTQVGANYPTKEINQLPTGRTPAQIAELAPGLTANTPNGGQVTISGAFAYDNVFLLNGVDINDNLFGSANNVFIEDAIDQTTVMTSGISAEYGRFSGGVINLITKSGGNAFSGSFRSNLSNDAWTDETPFEDDNGVERKDKLNTTYEGTLGGPIVKDRLWFFGAGRYSKVTTSQALRQTGIQYDSFNKNRRIEGKLTGTVAPGHTISGNYIDNTSDLRRLAFGASIDPHVEETPHFPNNLFVASYNGVLSPRLLANFQYSRKQFGFRDTGGTSTDIHDSPFFSLGIRTPGSFHYNAPYFDATDPEDRNNQEFAGSLSYFLSTSKTGSHDLKVGVDHYTSTNTGGNSQSATGFVFDADYLTTGSGSPLLGADGRLTPVFVPGETQLENWLATRGASIDIRTLSLYAQDRWLLTPKLTLNLGVRYERVRSEATGGIVGVDTDTWVPRLAASYDLTGDGKTVLQGSYAHYAGKYSEAQFARNTAVGNPAQVFYVYTGPEGQGLDFAPGFDLANYEPILGVFPTVNVFFESGLSSPITREATFSVGRDLWNKGFAKLTFTNRSYYNFVEDFIDDPSDTGKVDVNFGGVDYGTFDNVFYRNSDTPEREYRGLLMQANYRLRDNLQVEGHWTVQLRNNGNFEGESQNSPGNPSSVGDYPEILSPSRNFPVGRLNDFQRHKVRLWAIYTQGLGRFGSLDIAPLWRIESAQTFSLAALNVPLSDEQIARNPGYAQLPGGGFQTLFFGERGSESFKGYGLLDLSVNYSIPVFRNVSPWIKLEVLNVLNNQKQISWDTTVNPDPNSPRDEFGLPTGFIRGETFGDATANSDFPIWRPGQTGGRTFLLATGVRF